MKKSHYKVVALIFTLAGSAIIFHQYTSKNYNTPKLDQTSIKASTNTEKSRIAEGKNKQVQKIEGVLTALPKYFESPKENIVSQITLWKREDINEDKNGEINVNIDPQILDNFRVGQVVKLDLPSLKNPAEFKFGVSRNSLNNVKVWKGQGVNTIHDSLVVTQGKIETHINFNIDHETFSALIDNQTGQTTITRQSDIIKRTLPIDDGVQLTAEVLPPM